MKLIQSSMLGIPWSIGERHYVNIVWLSKLRLLDIFRKTAIYYLKPFDDARAGQSSAIPYQASQNADSSCRDAKTAHDIAHLDQIGRDIRRVGRIAHERRQYP